MAGTLTQEDFIYRCRANKFQDFTSNDTKEIYEHFTRMYKGSQVSEHGKYEVFDFELFIQYLDAKDFKAAGKVVNDALREYNLVLKLFETGMRSKAAPKRARTENRPLTPKARTPDSKQREMQMPSSRYSVNDKKINNTELRYIARPDVSKDYIHDSNLNEHLRLRSGPKGSGGFDWTAYSTRKKREENSAQFQSNETMRNRDNLMKDRDKHHFAYSSNDPYIGDQFNKTEKTNKLWERSNLIPIYRSDDPDNPKNTYGKIEGRQNNNSEGDTKNVRKIYYDTAIPLSFRNENRHGTVNQRSIRHGRSNEGERNIEPDRRTYVISDAETRRYKDTLNRRSEEASLLLRQGNPNIADLSDSNRPTNIAERFSELYSNEYTDAFEFLQKQGLTEENIVYHLLRIVRYAYEHCGKRASEELYIRRRIVQRERKALYEYITGEKEERIIKGLAAKRLKIDALALTKEVCDTFMKKDYMRLVPNGIDPQNKYLSTYTSNCVEIIWFMCVQDPPIVISCVKEGDRFDVSLYRAYTKSGTIVDFCVWPLVLLAENGPILSKGIAQGSLLQELSVHEYSVIKPY